MKTIIEILKNIKNNIAKHNIGLIYKYNNLNKTIKDKIKIIKVSIIKKQIILILLGSFLIALTIYSIIIITPIIIGIKSIIGG